MRAATVRQRLLEVLPSRSDYRRLCDYPARNGQRLSSDYSATIAERIPHRSFSKLSKNFSKPDQNFSKTVRKIERFFCAAGEGLPRAHGLSAGRLGRLGDGRQPRAGRDLPLAAIRGTLRGAQRVRQTIQGADGGRGLPPPVIMRTSARTGSGPGPARSAQGLGGAVQAIRGQRSGGLRAVGLAVRRPLLLLMLPCRCCCGPAGCAAVAVRSATAMPLWGVYAVAVAFLWRCIDLYPLA